MKLAQALQTLELPEGSPWPEPSRRRDTHSCAGRGDQAGACRPGFPRAMNTSGWALAGVASGTKQAAADHRPSPTRVEGALRRSRCTNGPDQGALDQGGDPRPTTKKGGGREAPGPAERPVWK